VQESLQSPLVAWENFYVIVGSSAGALTGLQFVVIALLNERARRGTSRELASFGSPNVVHFVAVLLLSCVLSAPWPSLPGASIAVAIFGLAGLGYLLVVIRRMRHTVIYQPVLEDWVFHAVLPVVAYAASVAGAFLLTRTVTVALFVLAAASLLLLGVGIHNAWDTATYIAMGHLDGTQEAQHVPERAHRRNRRNRA